jgi:signal transduction histidine kinase
MSHELRTPIHIILGYLELLTDGALGVLNDEQVSTLHRMRDRSLSLLDLVNATLELNRLDSGRAPVTLAKFTLPELFRELEADTAALPRRPGVALRFEMPQDITPLMSDRTKLKTIVKNLVGNAVKFTDKGSVTVRVTQRPSTGVVELAVADTGIGIRSEDQGPIFEMFRQGHGSNGSKLDGVGLGLYIVKRLCEQLGGEVALESAYGQGSTFRVRIPANIDGVTAHDGLRLDGRFLELPAGPIPRAAGAGDRRLSC